MLLQSLDAWLGIFTRNPNRARMFVVAVQGQEGRDALLRDPGSHGQLRLQNQQFRRSCAKNAIETCNAGSRGSASLPSGPRKNMS